MKTRKISSFHNDDDWNDCNADDNNIEDVNSNSNYNNASDYNKNCNYSNIGNSNEKDGIKIIEN